MKYYIRPATADADLDPVPCGLIIGEAGVVRIASQGMWVTIPSGTLLVGVPYMFSFTQLDGNRTTAANVFFLYEIDK